MIMLDIIYDQFSIWICAYLPLLWAHWYFDDGGGGSGGAGNDEHFSLTFFPLLWTHRYLDDGGVGNNESFSLTLFGSLMMFSFYYL